MASRRASGSSRRRGLESVRAALGIDHARTVTVGDQRNDLEMLAWAGRGVAMGQAVREVKEAADEVTASVDDHGLADVLWSLVPEADRPEGVRVQEPAAA